MSGGTHLAMPDRPVIVDLPARRYVIFSDLISGDQMIVVRGSDMETAHLQTGFVRYVGGVRPPVLMHAKRARS